MTNQSQQVVWMGNYEPFGKVAANASNSTEIFSRFPGQYLDSETGLYYNYFRDYDPSIGRYIESDPIGLGGGINTYAYVEGNPLKFFDFFGLAVDVCFYPDSAMGFGHVGFGVSKKGGENNTSGFYPAGSNPLDGPGVVRPDNGNKECVTLESDDDQDTCMEACMDDRRNNPGAYQLFNRQCTSFVRDCLAQCGLFNGNYPGPRPSPFFEQLR